MAVLIVSVGIITAVTSQENPSNEVTVDISANPKLATVVNQESINTPYIRDYLQVYNTFSDIPYEMVQQDSAVEALLTVGNKEDNIKGFEINDKRYAIHLIACDFNYQRCGFRINGVPTGSLHAYKEEEPESLATFNLDDAYKIKINSIIFDYCDNRRFCNLHYEAYDIVDVSVVPR